MRDVRLILYRAKRKGVLYDWGGSVCSLWAANPFENHPKTFKRPLS